MLGLRVGIGQLWQETNTFNPVRTTRADFEAFGVLRGDEVIRQLADVNEPGGFIQSLRAWEEPPTLVGLFRLPAWPAGTATPETFDWLLSEVRSAIKQAGRLDAVLLALHGAMVAENESDVEGAVLAAVRERMWPGTPLIATLDLHANITERMVRSCDALVLYHTAPHIDVFETGVRAAGLLKRVLSDHVRPVMAFQKIPLVLPAERANTQDPDSPSFALRQRLVELERSPGILCAGLATVQPWLDIAEMGSAAIVVAEDRSQAEAACAEIAQALWNNRTAYLPDQVEIAEAVTRARQGCDKGLMVLSDSADATTSGAPGDSTHVLAEILRHDWPRAALVPLVDPELVAHLFGKPEGTPWSGELGGKRDTRFGKPLAVSLELVCSFEARFMLSGHLGRNLAIDMGPSVVLRKGNVLVVVTSRSGPHFAPELFRAAGVESFDAAVLVAKSPCGFRAAYQSRAAEIILVRAPGCASADFTRLPYTQIKRPMYPWDNPEFKAAPLVFLS